MLTRFDLDLSHSLIGADLTTHMQKQLFGR